MKRVLWALLAAAVALPAWAADFVPVVVYSSSGKFDNSFSESAWKGAERFRLEFKVPYREVQIDDARHAEAVLDRIAHSDVDMVLAVGFAYQQAVTTVAARYPSTRFVLIDAKAEGRNVESVLFGQHEGSFLVGMLSAMTSRTGTLGFIGGMDVPVIRSFQCGFAQGARHVNRNVQVITDMVGDFNNPDRAAELARRQVDRKADVVFAAAGRSGLGVLRSARVGGPWAVGVDVNQNWVAPGAVLTSMVKRIDNAVYGSLKAGHLGHWRPGVRPMGLKEGGVEVSVDVHNRPLISPEMSARLDRARRDIVDGKLVVTDLALGGTCPGH